MNYYYTGIGSRSTPADILHWMYRIALRLAAVGYVLRSGGADGADSAFESGASHLKNIFLPWEGFNGRCGAGYIHEPTPEAYEMAAKYHPAWHKCKRGARALHARNCHQVLGHELDTPSQFVVCWHQNSGGTMQAIRIAKDRGITVYNLAEEQDVKALQKALQEIGA